MTDSGNGNDWGKHKLLILSQMEEIKKELENLQKNQQDVMKEIVEMKTQLSALKVQSGVWGMLAGAIPVAIALFFKWMTSK